VEEYEIGDSRKVGDGSLKGIPKFLRGERVLRHFSTGKEADLGRDVELRQQIRRGGGQRAVGCEPEVVVTRINRPNSQAQGVFQGLSSATRPV
jgi:hypothetical protein